MSSSVRIFSLPFLDEQQEYFRVVSSIEKPLKIAEHACTRHHTRFRQQTGRSRERTLALAENFRHKSPKESVYSTPDQENILKLAQV
jgi:hypothetical protein